MTLPVKGLTLDEVLSGVEPLSVTQVPVGSSLNDNGVSVFSAAPFGSSPLLIKSGPGRVYSYQMINLLAPALFILLLDSDTTPIAGSVPIFGQRLGAAGTTQSVFDQFGIYFSRKIWMAMSSTVHQYTPISTLAALVCGNYA